MRRIVLCCSLWAGLLGASASAAAAASLPPETIAARERFFGTANVDPSTGAVRSDRVILSWFSVTNFAMAVGGHVVLLDAWVARGEHDGYVPTTPEEVALLRPSHVFLGHGHSDHAADAGTVVARSGATLVGTPQHCDQVRRQVPGARVACVEAVERGAAPGAQRVLELLPGVGITAMRHVHSAARQPDGEPHVPVIPPPDGTSVVAHPPTPASLAHLATHLGDEEGGTMLYEFRLPGFRMVFHDSVGPLREDAPHVLRLLQAFRGPDLQLGSIQGFNQLGNGMRDVRDYVAAIRPKLFVPAHHDDWAPGVTTKGERYEPFLRAELGQLPGDQRPSVRFLYDPYDYLRPEILTFDLPAAPSAASAPQPCRSARRFRIRLGRRVRDPFVSARVYVNGERVRTLRGRKRLGALVDLRGLPKGRFVVVIVGRTKAGRTLVDTRRYRTCTPGGLR